MTLSLTLRLCAAHAQGLDDTGAPDVEPAPSTAAPEASPIDDTGAPPVAMAHRPPPRG